MDKKIGHYAFLAGMILAVLVGIVTPLQMFSQNVTQWIVSIMVVLGIVVGFTNINAKQQKDYLMVATMLIIAAGVGGATNIFGGIIYVGEYILGIFQGMIAVIIPATVVVLLREIWRICQSK